MAQLPLEIIQDVVTGYAPPPRNYWDRYDFLLPLCHLHPSLTPFVQRILFAHPIIERTTALNTLVEAMESGSVEMRDWPESLEIENCDLEESSAPLERLLLLCSEIKEVSLAGCSGFYLGVFARLPKLHTLTLMSVDDAIFHPLAQEPISFTSLVNLSCTAVKRGAHMPDDLTFFTPRTLPCLRRLYIAEQLEPVEFDSSGYSTPDISAALAGQLRHLYFDGDASEASHLLAEGTNLLSFVCNSYMAIPTLPRPGPPLLALHIWRGRHSETEEALKLLRGCLSSGVIDSRSAVFLPWPDGTSSAFSAVGLKEWRAKVGVKLDLGDGDSEGFEETDGDSGFAKFTEWVDVEAARRRAESDE